MLICSYSCQHFFFFSKYEKITFNMRTVDNAQLLASMTVPVCYLSYGGVMALDYGSSSASKAADILTFSVNKDNAVNIKYTTTKRNLEVIGWYKPEFVVG